MRLQLDFDQLERAGEEGLDEAGNRARPKDVLQQQALLLARRLAVVLQHAQPVAVHAEHQRVDGAGRPQREHDAAIEAVELSNASGLGWRLFCMRTRLHAIRDGRVFKCVNKRSYVYSGGQICETFVNWSLVNCWAEGRIGEVVFQRSIPKTRIVGTIHI